MGVKKKEFEDLVKSVSPKLYSFIYALVPDDLQAQQIVIDTLTVMTLQEKELIKSLLTKREGKMEEEEALIFNFKKRLFKHSYKLAFKRYHQLQESFHFGKSSRDEFNSFYQLEIEKRAILFLKSKTEYSITDISYILNLKEDELKAKLNLAKNSLLNQLGHSQLKDLEY